MKYSAFLQLAWANTSCALHVEVLATPSALTAVELETADFVQYVSLIIEILNN